MTPSITQSNIFQQLGAFLTAVLPAGVVVVVGEQNRVPEPPAGAFVLLTPLRETRLATNLDEYLDVRFHGSIAGASMTVSDVTFGLITPGATVFGVGVAANTKVQSQTSGPAGGPGVYAVAPSQTVGAGVLASGAETIEMDEQVAVQMHFHGSDVLSARDMAATASTLMRDDFAAQQFAAQTPNFGVAPLYADDGRQVPFVNDQQQVEVTWIVEAMLQANVVVSVPQQFADSVKATATSVQAAFGP